jgi:hypothetical protein
MRQSEGKKVANKLAAATFICAAKDETRDVRSPAADLVPEVRVWSRLLLKTTSYIPLR